MYNEQAKHDLCNITMFIDSYMQYILIRSLEYIDLLMQEISIQQNSSVTYLVV